MSGDSPYVTPLRRVDRDRLVEMLAQCLLKRWFPVTTPIDIKEWRRIAESDAGCVVDELMTHRLLNMNE